MLDVPLRFPQGFRWGVATSAHQVEGNNFNNQWYAWEQAGHILSGDHCGLACDWWDHAERDFDIAQGMGLNALRLSLEWSRIEPRLGVWDGPAIMRYRQMLQGLRQRGMEPLVTLHHFTHPLWFEARGGFLAPDAVDLFARYAAHVVRELGDLCDFWCTINEPNVVCTFGYQIGDFPPGHHGDLRGTVHAQATMARAHAAAYRALHAAQPTARVGWAQHYNTFDPANPHSPLDRYVARLQDEAFNEFFPHAVRTGTAKFPLSTLAGDLRAVKDTCDFLGINTYARDLVAFDPRRATELFGRRFTAPGAPKGDDGVTPIYSEMYPQGIARIVDRVRDWGKPIYITESGVPDRADRLRPWVITEGVQAMHAARQKGADVRGYYHWSLVDNFEWAQGWTLRFGLVAMDHVTQARTMRRSGNLYRAIIQTNALTPEMMAEYLG
jgi:beta-glucosidase